VDYQTMSLFCFQSEYFKQGEQFWHIWRRRCERYFKWIEKTNQQHLQNIILTSISKLISFSTEQWIILCYLLCYLC